MTICSLFKTKFALAFLCLISVSLLLSGCWDSRELNEIGISSGTAYDWEDNQWSITYQVINPLSSTSSMGSGGDPNTPPFLTFTERGKTILDAINRTNMTSTRQLFFAHNRITVFSETMARRGIVEVLDLFLRKPDARETVYVFISRRHAGDILKQLMQSSKNQGAGVQLMMRQEENLTSYYPGIRVFELSMALASESHCAVIPEINLTGDAIMDKTEETSVTDLPSRLALGSLAVLKQDKLIGWLTIKEAFGLNFLTNKVKSANISFPSDPKKPDKYDAALTLLHSKTKVKPIRSGDHFVMDVGIEGGGILIETGSAVDLSKPQEIKRLEAELNGQVTTYVKESWEALQKLDADATGFATLVHRKFPRIWKEIKKEDSWEQEFKKIEIRTHVDMKIERFGLANKSYKSVEQE